MDRLLDRVGAIAKFAALAALTLAGAGAALSIAGAATDTPAAPPTAPAAAPTATRFPPYTKPKVRAITGFLRLDRATSTQQISEALSVLRAAKAEFESQGYQIETLRIVTQPLAELVNGLTDADALKFLKTFDELGKKESFLPSVGPAMMRDSDDPKTMHLLAQALVMMPDLQANTIMAGDDGIDWKVIRETAALVRYVAELSRQLTVHAKVGESIGEKVAASTWWTFMGVDPTPAPLGDVSIGTAMETYTGAKFGSSGTLTAALVITTAVKAVPVKQIGYAGLMVPLMEDKHLAERRAEGTYNSDDR